MNIPYHIKLDIAIETIGKVIATYNQKLLFTERTDGVNEEEVFFKNRIEELENEIQLIYNSQTPDSILKKVEEEYIPYLQKELGFDATKFAVKPNVKKNYANA